MNEESERELNENEDQMNKVLVQLLFMTPSTQATSNYQYSPTPISTCPTQQAYNKPCWQLGYCKACCHRLETVCDGIIGI